MSGSLTTISGAVWRAPGSHVEIGWVESTGEYAALFFDGRHEAPALDERGITVGEAVSLLAASLRDNFGENLDGLL